MTSVNEFHERSPSRMFGQNFTYSYSVWKVYKHRFSENTELAKGRTLIISVFSPPPPPPFPSFSISFSLSRFPTSILCLFYVCWRGLTQTFLWHKVCKKAAHLLFFFCLHILDWRREVGASTKQIDQSPFTSRTERFFHSARQGHSCQNCQQTTFTLPRCPLPDKLNWRDLGGVSFDRLLSPPTRLWTFCGHHTDLKSRTHCTLLLLWAVQCFIFDEHQIDFF